MVILSLDWLTPEERAKPIPGVAANTGGPPFMVLLLDEATGLANAVPNVGDSLEQRIQHVRNMLAATPAVNEQVVLEQVNENIQQYSDSIPRDLRDRPPVLPDFLKPGGILEQLGEKGRALLKHFFPRQGLQEVLEELRRYPSYGDQWDAYANCRNRCGRFLAAIHSEHLGLVGRAPRTLVFFDCDDERLRSNEKDELENVVAVVKLVRAQSARHELKPHVYVDVRCSHVGDWRYNLALADRRGAAVRNALKARGVPDELIHLKPISFEPPQLNMTDVVDTLRIDAVRRFWLPKQLRNGCYDPSPALRMQRSLNQSALVFVVAERRRVPS